MDRIADMQRFQELWFSAGHDYSVGSPHLLHRKLHRQLVSATKSALTDVVARNLPRTVLEIGAGDGAFTESILAAGFRTTATEMSRPALAHLKQRFDLNPGFRAVFDPDGSLDVLGTQRFALIVCTAVLHHIPDYISALVSAIRNHLLDGGALVSFQDPMWYPTQPWKDWLADKACYFVWRLAQGNYRQGAKTRLRRAFGSLSQSEPADMVEYHVVRSGVNQTKILEMTNSVFESVHLISYWSTYSRLLQTAGEHLGIRNTFGIVALGCSPHKLWNVCTEESPQASVDSY
ncbi:MAG: class I SAM-dependent methyltransferase [Deltaproteobacteria bacterium]|nr:class I SAM-dependent methyltransferase [Deltaproteobacteria bacterium]